MGLCKFVARRLIRCDDWTWMDLEVIRQCLGSDERKCWRRLTAYALKCLIDAVATEPTDEGSPTRVHPIGTPAFVRGSK